MTAEEKLQKEIKDAQEKLRLLKESEKFSKRNEVIKQLKDYSTDEKVEWFNKMYANAKEELEELEEKGYSDDDNVHYAWKTYITILAKTDKEFWNYWNSFDY